MKKPLMYEENMIDKPLVRAADIDEARLKKALVFVWVDKQTPSLRTTALSP